jgi:7-cyano-7-deazaguanine synthase in queuosine biosynthesis
MIIPHSKHNLNIVVFNNVSSVGLKISGGADSAITGYILSKYVVEERPDLKIVPITVDQEGKAFQIQFAKKIVEFYKKEFGDIFLEHETAYSPLPEDENYIKTQQLLTNNLYKNNKIQFHFAGITQNPPKNAIPRSVYWRGWTDPPDRERLKNIYEGTACHPLINFNKRDVAELYRYFNVFDTLFPMTRSCEKYTDNFEKHCGNCWFCAERRWGFDRL